MRKEKPGKVFSPQSDNNQWRLASRRTTAQYRRYDVWIRGKGLTFVEDRTYKLDNFSWAEGFANDRFNSPT